MKISKVTFDKDHHFFDLHPIDESLNCALRVPMPFDYSRPTDDAIEKLSRIDPCISLTSDRNSIDVELSFKEDYIRIAEILNESMGASLPPLDNTELFQFRDLVGLAEGRPLGYEEQLTFSCWNNPVLDSEWDEYKKNVRLPRGNDVEVADIADRFRELKSWQQDAHQFASYTTIKNRSWRNLYREEDLNDFADSHAEQVCRQALFKTIQVYKAVFSWKHPKSRGFVYSMLFHPEHLVRGEEEWLKRQEIKLAERKEILELGEDLDPEAFFKHYQSALTAMEGTLDGWEKIERDYEGRRTKSKGFGSRMALRKIVPSDDTDTDDSDYSGEGDDNASPIVPDKPSVWNRMKNTWNRAFGSKKVMPVRRKNVFDERKHVDDWGDSERKFVHNT